MSATGSTGKNARKLRRVARTVRKQFQQAYEGKGTQPATFTKRFMSVEPGWKEEGHGPNPAVAKPKVKRPSRGSAKVQVSAYTRSRPSR